MRSLVAAAALLLVGAVAPPDPFAEFAALCGKVRPLWGRDACGPLLLVDPATRAIHANAPDAKGALKRDGTVWSGTLPGDVPIANTALDWNGVRWTMLRRPLPGDARARRILLVHEAFHRIQPALGLQAREADNGHLDGADGRIWLRLELRALDTALAGGTNWREAARDALAFRAERRRLAGAEAAAAEDALERNEGLAEYTGIRVGAGSAAIAAARARLAEIAARPSYVRSFAYATGPGYGLLLDHAGGNWRRAVLGGAPMDRLLTRRVGAPGSLARAPMYGEATIRTEEEARAASLATRNRDYRARLIDGPVLRIAFVKMNIEFDPNRVFALAGEGSVYPAMTVRDAWGTLTVTGDALLASDWSNVRVAGPAARSGDRLTGPGWTLVLAPGWEVEGTGREQRLLKRP